MTFLSRIKRYQIVLSLIILPVLPFGARSLICRSDPVVILTNGVTLDIGASLDVLPFDVTEVHYELHVPKGVHALLAIHTPAWLTSQETFKVIDDMSGNNYKVITTAHTRKGDASVTADTVLVSALKIKLGAYSASGSEGDALTVSFRG
jgi:hypothetical protein